MKIAPSMLSCDFSQMGNQTQKMDKAKADFIHLDVMDGHFVPNLTFGAPVIKAIRPFTELPFDVHLMISNPLDYIDDFAKSGADIITFHIEADSPIKETIEKIKAHNILAGLVIKPNTPADAVFPYLEMLDWVLVMTVEPGFGGQSFMEEQLIKVKQIKEQCKKMGKEIVVEIDGGIGVDNIKQAHLAGVDVCVAGTAVFKAEDTQKAISELKQQCV